MKPDLQKDWQATTLVLGDVERWRSVGKRVPAVDGTVFAAHEQISTEFMALTQASLVLSPLFMRGADAVDIAIRLIDSGFAGCYRAISMSMPNPGMVRDEVRAVAPELDFDLISFPALLRAG